MKTFFFEVCLTQHYLNHILIEVEGENGEALIEHISEMARQERFETYKTLPSDDDGQVEVQEISEAQMQEIEQVFHRQREKVLVETLSDSQKSTLNTRQASQAAEKHGEAQEKQAADYTITATKWLQWGKVGVVLVEADVPTQYQPQYRAYIGACPENAPDETAKKQNIARSGEKLTYSEAKAFFPRIQNQTQYVL